MAEHSTDKDGKTTATIRAIVHESPTVKRLVLHVEDSQVTFKAGQWVDFFIPGMTVFTGFSMCSSPKSLEATGTLELAVKYSDYPPTDWVHTRCQVGDQVQIKVAGSFSYAPSLQDDPCDLLLLAAGIGINPIYSIFRHHADFLASGHGQTQQSSQSQGKVALLYSAKDWDELVFTEAIVETASKMDNAHVQLFTTTTITSGPSQTYVEGPPVTSRRMREEDIKRAMAGLDTAKTEVFMCGPASFIDDMERVCLGIGLPQSRIHYEKWW